MASGPSLWTACGPVALPLLLLSLAVFTVAFVRGSFWWRYWRQGRRPWRALQQQLAACSTPQERSVVLNPSKPLLQQGRLTRSLSQLLNEPQPGLCLDRKGVP
jgi:hypothetical protein